MRKSLSPAAPSETRIRSDCYPLQDGLAWSAGVESTKTPDAADLAQWRTIHLGRCALQQKMSSVYEAMRPNSRLRFFRSSRRRATHPSKNEISVGFTATLGETLCA
jgi:hypothetical protein